MVGSGSPSAERARAGGAWLVAILLAASSAAAPQSLYKYRGDDGEWVYSDRRPVGEVDAEVRDLPSGGGAPRVLVSHAFGSDTLVLAADNEYHAPVELVLGIDRIRNLESPGDALQWTLEARARSILLELPVVAGGVPEIGYRYTWIVGEPGARHRPTRPYRAPFAIAAGYEISQAWPDTVTHERPDSRYAVDFVMPVGTGVRAARGGTVFEVTASNWRGGLDPERDGPAANLVRILHADGTYAEYGHLNRSTVRVRPGDVVRRGDYIADSGNTGFSSGPHLHFAVIRNLGLEVESVPISFEGPGGTEVTPRTGMRLVAY